MSNNKPAYSNKYDELVSSIATHNTRERWRRVFSFLGVLSLLGIVAAGIAGSGLFLGIFFGLFAMFQVSEAVCVSFYVSSSTEVAKNVAAVDTDNAQSYTNLSYKRNKGRSLGKLIVGNVFFYIIPTCGLAGINFMMSMHFLGAAFSFFDFGIDSIVTATSMTSTALPVLMLVFMLMSAYGMLMNLRDIEVKDSRWGTFSSQGVGIVMSGVLFFGLKMFTAGGLVAVGGLGLPITTLVVLAVVLVFLAIRYSSHLPSVPPFEEAELRRDESRKTARVEANRALGFRHSLVDATSSTVPQQLQSATAKPDGTTTPLPVIAAQADYVARRRESSGGSQSSQLGTPSSVSYTPTPTQGGGSYLNPQLTAQPRARDGSEGLLESSSVSDDNYDDKQALRPSGEPESSPSRGEEHFLVSPTDKNFTNSLTLAPVAAVLLGGGRGGNVSNSARKPTFEGNTADLANLVMGESALDFMSEGTGTSARNLSVSRAPLPAAITFFKTPSLMEEKNWVPRSFYSCAVAPSEERESLVSKRQ